MFSTGLCDSFMEQKAKPALNSAMKIKICFMKYWNDALRVEIKKKFTNCHITNILYKKKTYFNKRREAFAIFKKYISVKYFFFQIFNNQFKLKYETIASLKNSGVFIFVVFTSDFKCIWISFCDVQSTSAYTCTNHK